MPATETHCPYCALQCGIRLTPEKASVRLEPTDFTVNKGGLCAKGWTAAELLDHRDRLLTPLVRKEAGDRTSPLREATWDEALDRIVTAITASQERYGPDSVGAFGGGGLTNEKAYTLGKFVRVALRSASIDYNGRFCMSSAAAAANRSFGVDRGLPFPVADIAEARTVLLVGANPADALPPSMQYFDAGRASGARHVVVDPRRTATACSPRWSARTPATAPARCARPRGTRRWTGSSRRSPRARSGTARTASARSAAAG